MALKTPADFIKTLSRLDAGTHVALAVSGGGDSMGLLALAARSARLKNAPRFSVLTVDHGLRKAARAEAKMVARVCADLGLKHVTLRDTQKLSGRDIQQQARRLRYRLMAAWCARHKAQSLVLAHHQDDQAETVLMRLAKGSGINGLAGMAEKQKLATSVGDLVLLRPFLGMPSAQLKRWAQQAKLPISDDPSNVDAQFERVRWRQAMPHLADLGMDAAALGGLADDMRAVRRALDGQLLDWLDAHAQWHDYGVLCLPRAAYMALDDGLKTRLMAAFVRFFGGHEHPLKRARIRAFATRPEMRPSGAATLGGAHLRWRGKTMFLGRELAACQPHELTHGVQLWDNRFFVKAKKTKNNLFVAPLGRQGVQDLRDGGSVFDKAVPACYYAVLPAFFSAKKRLACPLMVPQTGFSAKSVYSKALFRDILSGGQG